MWDESLDYFYSLDKCECQYQYQLNKLKYETQLQELICNNQIDILQNKNCSIDNKEPFIVVYKKEMPKGGYFEGCTLELIGKNPNYNFNII